MAWWTLYRREMGSYFQSMVAYMLLFSSAVTSGFIFYIYMTGMVEYSIHTSSIIQLIFNSAFFYILALVQIPLLTMRVFSEEFKLGTIEMLLTAPVNEWSIVVAKYLGALTFFALLWSPLALDILALQTLTNPPPTFVMGEVLTTCLIVFLIGAFWVSVGVFSSVLTKNQIVAAILSFCFLFGLVLVAMLGMELEDSLSPELKQVFSYVSVFQHISTGVAGVLDTRYVVFYCSMVFFMLLCTQRVLLARRLQS